MREQYRSYANAEKLAQVYFYSESDAPHVYENPADSKAPGENASERERKRELQSHEEPTRNAGGVQTGRKVHQSDYIAIAEFPLKHAGQVAVGPKQPRVHLNNRT